MVIQETQITLQFYTKRKNLSQKEFEEATRKYLSELFIDATELEIEINQDETETLDNDDYDDADYDTSKD